MKKKRKISLRRLKGLNVCRICGEFIISDAWCTESHMNHNHKEVSLEHMDWFEDNIRTISGDDILNIIINNLFIKKQVKRNCDCIYCHRAREFNKKKEVQNK